jgi:hypothetical protein
MITPIAQKRVILWLKPDVRNSGFAGLTNIRRNAFQLLRPTLAILSKNEIFEIHGSTHPGTVLFVCISVVLQLPFL